jgi:acetyl esterase/lipase
VLVIGGERDLIYENGRVFTQTAAQIVGARLILYPGKGHLGVLGGKAMGRAALAFLAEGTPGTPRGGQFAAPSV